MKVIDLFEYKNKYYKKVGPRPKPRKKNTLWYNDYENWAQDITTRFPDANAYYDEENEEIVAMSDESNKCYGKWSKKGKDYKGVSFYTGRDPLHVTSNAKRLKRLEDK